MLRISTISFPGFGLGEFDVNSVAFTVFGLEIAWYAIIITCGMIASVLYTVYRAQKIGITFDDILDFALFTIPIGVIGARLYYVLTTLEQYDSFLDVINIRNGGLAIYGGIITGTLTVFIICRVKKIKFIALADCVAPSIILAQSIGRWGNFMNGEAFGEETTIFCKMGLNNELTNFETIYVHPTFLYESLWNIIGFVLINIFYKKKQYDGQFLFVAFGWYGLGRFWIEGLRTDSLYIPGTSLRISQLLAGLVFLVCLGFTIYFAIKKPKGEFYVKEQKSKE